MWNIPKIRTTSYLFVLGLRDGEDAVFVLAGTVKKKNEAA